jgi:hypothetical protein
VSLADPAVCDEPQVAEIATATPPFRVWNIAIPIFLLESVSVLRKTEIKGELTNSIF